MCDPAAHRGQGSSASHKRQRVQPGTYQHVLLQLQIKSMLMRPQLSFAAQCAATHYMLQLLAGNRVRLLQLQNSQTCAHSWKGSSARLASARLAAMSASICPPAPPQRPQTRAQAWNMMWTRLQPRSLRLQQGRPGYAQRHSQRSSQAHARVASTTCFSAIWWEGSSAKAWTRGAWSVWHSMTFHGTARKWHLCATPQTSMQRRSAMLVCSCSLNLCCCCKHMGLQLHAGCLLQMGVPSHCKMHACCTLSQYNSNLAQFVHATCMRRLNCHPITCRHGVGDSNDKRGCCKRAL